MFFFDLLLFFLFFLPSSELEELEANEESEKGFGEKLNID